VAVQIGIVHNKGEGGVKEPRGQGALKMEIMDRDQIHLTKMKKNIRTVKNSKKLLIFIT
jgi:hypothetical protein